MIQKPITVARSEYMQGIVDLTNQSKLPTFVIVDILEQVLKELRPLMDTELKRDEARWRAAQQEESNKLAEKAALDGQPADEQKADDE